MYVRAPERILGCHGIGGIVMIAPREKPEYPLPPGEGPIPELEDDEKIAPRPEEEIADRLRAEPDAEGHGTRSS